MAGMGTRESAAIKVLIVGELLTVEEALQRALATAAGVDVIGIGRDIAETERLLSDPPPDVILAYGGTGHGADARLVEQILARHPDARVVVMAADTGDGSLHSFVAAGAFGLVNIRLDSFEELVSALRRAAAGEFLLSAETLRKIIQHQRTEVARERQRTSMIRRLTGRELEVLALVAAGLDNRMIAEKLCISVTTVRSHVQHLLAKLDVHSKLEAAMLANRYELAPGTANAPAIGAPGLRHIAAS